MNREKWSQFAAAVFGVDHFIAQVIDPNLAVDYENLVYACARCNSYKQEHQVLDPCQVALSEHLHIAEDGTIEALTEAGGDFVQVLGLDDPLLMDFRCRLTKTLTLLSQSEDAQAQELVADWLSFPLDLPDLSQLRPKDNTRPEGINESYYARRRKGELPTRY